MVSMSASYFSRTKTPTYIKHARYLNRFLGMRCAPDLLVAGLIPNVKEITESLAAFVAVVDHVAQDRFSRNNSNVAIVCVGDGHKPRTAAMFACLSKWTCFSIDPAMKDVDGQVTFNGITFQRLHVLGKRVEDTPHLDVSGYEHVVIVGVHSHATIKNIMTGIVFDTADFVMIPCCVKQPVVGGTSGLEYVDENIWSPHNKVAINHDVQRTTV
jgi:hypothetical protein